VNTALQAVAALVAGVTLAWDDDPQAVRTVDAGRTRANETH
jgi:hypothetical protein